MKTAWQKAAAGAAVLFFLFAVVQYNDPDPLLWIMLYGLTAGLSALYAINQFPQTVTLVVCLAALGVTVYLALRVLGQQPIFDEEGREMFGGVLVAGWLGALLWQARRPVAP